MRWEGHVAGSRGREVFTDFWWVNLRKRYNMDDTGVEGMKIRSWIFRKLDVGHIMYRSDLGSGQVRGHS
jgi:hypothetical protein